MGNNASDVRRIDPLGRIVIPKVIREVIGVGEGDALAIKLDGNKIVMEVYESACLFCGSQDNLSEFKGRVVCACCRQELAK